MRRQAGLSFLENHRQGEAICHALDKRPAWRRQVPENVVLRLSWSTGNRLATRDASPPTAHRNKGQIYGRLTP
jgi:hypothetical protein